MATNKVAKIKEYYNSRYSNRGDEAFRPWEAYPEFLDYLGVSSGRRLLDVGCGNGFLLSAAEQRGLQTFGIDISEAAAELARKNAPNSEIRVGRAESLDYLDDYFDYLTCLGTLEHCLDIDKALSEMYRVTKKSAKICIMVPNLNYIMWKLHGQAGTEQQEINEQLFSLKEWLSILNRNGFAIQKNLQDKWGAHNIRIFGTKHPKDILLRMLMKLLWYFMPLRFTYQFIFICIKKEGQNR